jgi:hypothetical protein
MALLSGSPALNVGDNTLIPSGILYDQRGSGYSRIYGAAVDIGAYEAQPAVNEAPIRTSGGIGPIPVIAGSEGVSLGLANLAYRPGGPDEAGQTLTYTVTALPPSNLGQILLANGARVKINTTYTLQQIQGMMFVPSGRPGTVTFQFAVTDNGGTANGGIDTLLETLTITIQPRK